MRSLHGYREDIPDGRDFKYVLTVKSLPSSIDLRNKWIFKIENQGSQGSCAANATASAIEFVLSNSGDSPEVSRSFLYYMARSLRNWQNQDTGSLIRDNIKVAASIGIASEFCMPYNDRDYKTPPSLKCLEEANRHKIGNYYSIDGIEQYKTCLSEGYPVIFGMYLFSQFMNNVGGKIEMPSGVSIGGHAMVMCGYDDAKEYLIIRNSWGPFWGDGGFAYLPYDYLRTDGWSDDAWTIREVKS